MNGLGLENVNDNEVVIDSVNDAVEQESLAPFVEPTAAEKEARLQALVSSADEREAVHKAADSEDDSEDETVPLTERATLRLAERFEIGKRDPLVIHLRAPVILTGARIKQEIARVFPAVFLIAASMDRFGKGIDIDVLAAQAVATNTENRTAIIMHNDAVRKKAERTGETWESVDVPDALSYEDARETIQDQIDAFTQSIEQFDFDNLNGNDKSDRPHPLNVICDIVWLLAQDDNPVMNRQELPKLLASHLTTTEFADLARAIFRCLSGSDVTYENDPFSVFRVANGENAS